MNFFKKMMAPAPSVPLMDESKVDGEYKYWRMRILYSMFIGYAVYYLTRGTFTMILPDLKEAGYSEVALGWIMTAFQISYGVSKFVNGIAADKSNSRYFMAFGLIMTGVANIFLGLSSSIALFGVLWVINGWFQGWGSAPCHKLLAYWYSRSERGRWWGIWNTSHNVGAAILPKLVVFAIGAYGSWRYGVIAPGIIAIITGFYLINRLRDKPSSVGLPSVEVFKKEELCEADKKEEAKNSTVKEILFNNILCNKYIWLLSFAYFFVYIVRWSISHWGYHYFVSGMHFTKSSAATCISLYEIGGFFGSLTAGWFSDILFKGRRGPVNLLFCIGIAASLVILRSITTGAVEGASNIYMIYVMMTLVGFFLFGPQMLLAVASVELTSKKASATAVGFLGIVAYIGCSFTGGPLGHVIKDYGWDSFFQIIVACSVLSVLVLIPLWGVKSNFRKKK